jgi:hypothetical protein
MPSPNDFQTLILFVGLGFGFRSVPVMRLRAVQARPATLAATAVFEPRLQLPEAGGVRPQPPVRRRLIARR